MYEFCKRSRAEINLHECDSTIVKGIVNNSNVFSIGIIFECKKKKNEPVLCGLPELVLSIVSEARDADVFARLLVIGGWEGKKGGNATKTLCYTRAY